MKTGLQKIARLMLGFFLYALGITFSINARLGLAPWDVFHQGLSYQLGNNHRRCDHSFWCCHYDP